jgi:hypothetical protein
MTTPRKGDTFTHQRYLDADRNPAQMRVTHVTKTAVYFTYVDATDNKGAFWLDLAVWVERYGARNPFPSPVDVAAARRQRAVTATTIRRPRGQRWTG